MKYEYKFVPIRFYGVTAKGLTKKHEEEFNNLGNDRWELISIQNGANARQMTAIFKRELLNE